MKIVERDRKILLNVASHIAHTVPDEKAAKSYRYITKGSGTIENLTDNLSLVTMVRAYPEIAAQIRPAGREITSAYLDEVTNRSIRLLQSKGIKVVHGVPQSTTVDRQNRLLTLCLNARRSIKYFAAAAFLENPDHYNDHYVQHGKPATDESETDTPSDAPNNA